MRRIWITALVLIALAACHRGNEDDSSAEQPPALPASPSEPIGSQDQEPSLSPTLPVAATRSLRLEQSGWRFSLDAALRDGTSRIDIVAHSATVGAAPMAMSQRLAGKLMEAFATDLDADGFPELLLWLRDGESSLAGPVVGWRFEPSGRAKPLALPALGDDDAVGWRGGDQFGVQGTLLVRSYPLYREDDEQDSPTGGFVRVLDYALRDGALVLEHTRLEPAAGSPQAELLER